MSGSMAILARLISPEPDLRASSDDKHASPTPAPLEDVQQLEEIAGGKNSTPAERQDAVEALLNLSVWYDNKLVASAATQALVGLYRNPPDETGALRATIEGQSARLFEIRQHGFGKQRDLVADVPRPLLCLAYMHFQEKNYSALKYAICQIDKSCAPGFFYEDSQLLAPAAELSKVKLVSLPSGFSGEGFIGLDGLASIIKRVDSFLTEECSDRASFFFVNDENHWVGLLGLPYNKKEGGFGRAWMVIDTNASRGDESSLGKGVQELVQGQLNAAGSGACALLQDNLQEERAANSCGLFQLGLIQQINELLIKEENGVFKSPAACLMAVGNILKNWKELPQKDLDQMMAGLRAQIALTPPSDPKPAVHRESPSAPVAQGGKESASKLAPASDASKIAYTLEKRPVKKPPPPSEKAKALMDQALPEEVVPASQKPEYRPPSGLEKSPGKGSGLLKWFSPFRRHEG